MNNYESFLRIRLLLVCLTLAGIGFFLPIGASAAPVTYTANATLTLTSPSVTFTVASGSVADSVAVNATSVIVTLSASTEGKFDISSASRDFDVIPAFPGVTTSCTGSVSSSTIASQNDTFTYKIIPSTNSAAPCGTSATPASVGFGVSTSGGGGGGGGGGGAAAPVAAVTATTTPATPAVPATLATPATPATPAVPAVPATPPAQGSLQSQLNALLAQLSNLQQQRALGGASTGAVGQPSFTEDLQINSRGEDVRQLQIFLNNNGFPVASAGAGSAGNETDFFGRGTRAALMKYQASVGVSSTGYLGPLTRAKIAGTAVQPVQPSAPSAVAPTPPVPGSVPADAVPPAGSFARFLGLGSRGSDVTALQNLLTNLGLYQGPISGYLGNLTNAAVKAFQEKYGIAQAGDPGYGFVGPKTRAKLNEIVSGVGQ